MGKVDREDKEVLEVDRVDEACDVGESVMERKGNSYKYLVYHNNRGYTSSYNPYLICSLHYNPG